MRVRPIKNSRVSKAANISASQKLNGIDNKNKISTLGEEISNTKNISEEPITTGNTEGSGDATVSPTTEVEISPVTKFLFKLAKVLSIVKTKRDTPSTSQLSTSVKQDDIQINDIENSHVELETQLANAQEDLRLMQVKLQELELTAQEKAKLNKGLFVTKNAKQNAKIAKQKLTLHKAKMQPFIDAVIFKQELLNAHKKDITLTKAQIQQLSRQPKYAEKKQKQRQNKLKELIKKNKLTTTIIEKFKAKFKKNSDKGKE